MRINLNCPYEEKDIAKSLGARWDIARKVWFIVDVEDLTPFMRWIADAKPSKQQSKKVHRRPNSKAAVATKSAYVPHCGCAHVLPWEDCEHTKH